MAIAAIGSGGIGVSVVIPAYNYASFLPDAIHSALAQTWSPLEVIVVDDGSTDATAMVLSEINDPRLRVIHQPNAGLSAARNTGIRAASFDFIAFLDADDRWADSFLETVAGALKASSPEIAIAACGWQRMTKEGSLVEQPKRFTPPPSLLSSADFIIRNRFFPSAVVARKSAFAECGDFDTSLRSSEDRDMWIRITTRYKARYIDSPLAHIRRHGENMSKNAGRMRSNTAITLKKAWKAGAVSKVNILFWSRARAVFEYSSAWTHFSSGSRGLALKYLLYSFLLWPIFLHPSSLSERPLFRLRALRNFLFEKAELPKLKPISADK